MRWITFAAAALFAGAAPATADTLTLNFTSLPTVQGWSYNSNGGPPLPESSFYTATGTRLEQNTFGFPAGTFDGYYAHAVTLASSRDFTLRVNASVTAADTAYPLGFIFGLDSLYVGITATSLGLVSTANGLSIGAMPVGFDPVPETAYVLSRVGDRVRLTANGLSLIDAMLAASGPLSDRVVIGDGTKFANASGYYSLVDFRSVGVPEPASWAMMIAGFGLVGTMARRRGAIVTA